MRSAAARAISKLLSPPHWHNIFLVILLAGFVADFLVGLETVLNAISIVVVVSIGVALVSIIVVGLGALAWITVRDAVEVTSSDRQDGRAWRWRIPAYLGLVGILIDGLAGTWHVFQQHILFSTAIEKMPLAGVPVWLLLLSYPLKWIEQASFTKDP